jgi:DNA-binding LytR/AlgR family response regulator
VVPGNLSHLCIDMSHTLNQILVLLKRYLGIFLGIAIGVFLFILFFQPFPFHRDDVNNQLTLVAGLSVIIFLLTASVKLASWVFFHPDDPLPQRPVWWEFLSGAGIFVLGSVSFAFYLRYVGKVPVTFQLMTRVMLICLGVAIALRLYDVITRLRHSHEVLEHEKRQLQLRLDQLDISLQNPLIEFFSEYKTEHFPLLVSEVAFIRSADNYVEIVYVENGLFRKKLLRNTLKEIEIQARPYPDFVRCHRVCIVNTRFIEKLTKGQDNYWITIRGYDEKIPVSRQNILKLKELV